MIRRPRLFNVFHRIMGLWFTVLGGATLLAGIVGCVRWAIGAKTVPIEAAVTQTAVAGIVTTFGIAFLRVRPYRTGLGDEALLGVFTRRPAPTEPRKWWTGGPK